MTDFLSDKRGEIDARLKELRPLHDEYLKLERAREALEGIDGGVSDSGAGASNGRRKGNGRRKPGRPRGSKTGSGTGSGTKRRRRRGGTRAEQTLAAVRQVPGITVAELADKVGIKHKNYLYRVLNGLQSDGAVAKQGKGYVAK